MPLLSMAVLPAPPPPLPIERSSERDLPPWVKGSEAVQEGQAIELNGQRLQARWRWQDGPGRRPSQLWIPLDVLEAQLGFVRRDRSSGELELEWFGQSLQVPSADQRSLQDEVAVDVARPLLAAGARVEPMGGVLQLHLSTPQLLRVRSRDVNGSRRVVLDLSGPTWLRQADARLALDLTSTTELQQQLQSLGLSVRPGPVKLSLGLGGAGADTRISTLGGPNRVVIDLSNVAAGRVGDTDANNGAATAAEPNLRDPRLLALLGYGVQLGREVHGLGQRRLLISSVRLDPRLASLDLRPLTRPDGMQGLSSLPVLAQQEQAVIAINGGYFNRINRLPLGAVRVSGRWLSGPILNRGAMAWQDGELPRFGRLTLQETLADRSGQRWPITLVNSGYVQRGISRYTADWGRFYRALSGAETGLLLRGGVVLERYESDQLSQGIPLSGDDVLLIGRAGAVLPWGVGERLNLSSWSSDPLGLQPYVIGGGPLLLQGGRIVLNGGAESFSPAFLQQGAPRTVVGSDGRQLWLVTLQGVGHGGPTLGETALALQQLGLQEALNLDGGSSTGLVIAGTHTVKGRGVSASIHNGLGLIPRRTVQVPGGGSLTSQQR
ncbi:phosphodiester glycosidase family protein [Cyanobium sp. Morenito 9A2]|nr:phosphodiester glycosidase family protein [Cyanobium sp. Morenito 9A2]